MNNKPPIDLNPPNLVKKLKTSVALPINLLPQIKSLTTKHGISVSDYITRLIRDDLKSRNP
jgi:hypothetical protein